MPYFSGVIIAHFTLKVIGGSCLANATEYSSLKKKKSKHLVSETICIKIFFNVLKPQYI